MRQAPDEVMYAAALVAHEAARQLAQVRGRTAAPGWDLVDADTRAELLDHVRLLASGYTVVSLHDAWTERMRVAGWHWGFRLDVERKEHPGLTSWDRLPADQRAHDEIVANAALAFIDNYSFHFGSP